MRLTLAEVVPGADPASPGILDAMGYVPTARHLLRARDLADARYADPLTVAELAHAAGLSQAHFSRAFRQAFGESPHAYLLTRRLERAAALLRNTDGSVADICIAVGLASIGSFTSSFKRMFGRTPTAYRASFPPAATFARVPACVVRAYARPQRRTFREDDHPGAG
jgi:transcriptional regulator GlxA family with amidase domain